MEELRARRLAREYLRQFPEIGLSGGFRHLRARTPGSLPTLHLDDSSAIVGMMESRESIFFQERARLRAASDDVVASCMPPCDAFERYCDQQLALGSPRRIHVRPPGSRYRLAAGCWTDREARRELVAMARAGEICRIHPYMGNFHVWALAQLLSEAADSPLEVQAPPPGLVRKVNDKTWFTELVRRVLGEAFVPESYQVCNFSSLAWVINQYLADAPHIVIKLPDSAGGKGNLLLDPSRFRGESVGAIRAMLREELLPLQWAGECRLLVSIWEEKVICSPSVQLWLPPAGTGDPVIEGLFNQEVDSGRGEFMGSVPADFPVAAEEEAIHSSAVLGRLFQLLGYVGRCSFDLLLVGDSLSGSRLKIIECNGRWGGTSGPMSLMNRWFGDWALRPYASHHFKIPGLERLAFVDLLEAFQGELLDVKKRTGWLAFLDAAGLPHSRINVLALGEDLEEARYRISDWLPPRLDRLTGKTGPGPSAPKAPEKHSLEVIA
jgi:hypothetical protein